MSLRKKFTAFFGVILANFILPTIASAQFQTLRSLNRTCFVDGNCDLCDAVDIVGSIAEMFIGISGSVSLLMAVWFGFQMIFPGGNEEKISRAKNGLVAASIGLAIVLLAWNGMNYGLAMVLGQTGTASEATTPRLFASSGNTQAWYEICKGSKSGRDLAVDVCQKSPEGTRCKWFDTTDGLYKTGGVCTNSACKYTPTTSYSGKGVVIEGSALCEYCYNGGHCRDIGKDGTPLGGGEKTQKGMCPGSANVLCVYAGEPTDKPGCPK